MSGLPVTVGVDLSTTSAKALVRRIDGKVLATAAVPYPTSYLAGGQVEQHAEDWWTSTAEAIRIAVARSKAGQRVRALCITTQGISIVPVDAEGRPLRPAICWLDLRAEAEATALEQTFGSDEFFRRTGRRPHASFSLPKIAWLRAHERALFHQTARWLTPLPFLVARLIGDAVTDHTQAAGMLAYELHRNDWSDDLLAWAGLSRDAVPPIAWAGTDLGPIREEIARGLGLPGGVRMVLGAQDQKIAAYGAGISGGVVTVSLGTAAAISGLVDAIPDDPGRTVPVSPYLRPDLWALEAVVPAAAASLEWLARTAGSVSGTRVTVARLIELAESSPEGANGVRFLPHLAGTGTPHWDGTATGSFTGLTLGTRSGDLARAVLEGIAQEIAGAVDSIRQLGVNVDELRLMGGGARSSLWCRIIEHAVGVRTTATETAETAALGAAILATTSRNLNRAHD
jgi:xylulokinase